MISAGIFGLVFLGVFALSFVGLIFWVIKLIEVAKVPDWQYQAAGTTKITWVLVVVLAGWIGALIWQVVERDKVLAVPQQWSGQAQWPGQPRWPGQPGPGWPGQPPATPGWPAAPGWPEQQGSPQQQQPGWPGQPGWPAQPEQPQPGWDQQRPATESPVQSGGETPTEPPLAARPSTD